MLAKNCSSANNQPNSIGGITMFFIIILLLVIITFAVAPDFMYGLLTLAFWLAVGAAVIGAVLFALAMVAS